MWSEISRKVYALESPCCSESLMHACSPGSRLPICPGPRRGRCQHTPEDAGGARTAGSSLYVALVGHEHQQADQLARLLTQQGFQVGVFDAWPERASAAGVDLIVLDLGDAAADQGVELIARVRSQVSNMPPILALTVARRSPIWRACTTPAPTTSCSNPAHRGVRGARAGAGAARLSEPGAADRRAQSRRYAIDVAARRLSLNGQSVKLSSREFDLALYLFRNVGRLVSRAIGKRRSGAGSWASIPRRWTRTSTACGSSSDCNRKTAATGQRVCAGFRLIQVVTLS